MSRKPVLLVLAMIAAGVLHAPSAEAACTAAETRALIAQGLSDAEIDRRCGGEAGHPAWLRGTWHKTERLTRSNVPGFVSGPTIETWQIETGPGDALRIATVRDSHLAIAGLSRAEPLEVRDVAIAPGRLAFTVRTRFAGSITTARYELDLGAEEDHVTGRFQSRGTSAFGLPPLEMEGTVELVKE